MIQVKEHEDGVVAIADSNLIGKEFEEENFCLKVTENFYKGEEKTRAEVVEIIRNSNNLNIVGEEAVKVALEEGFISQEDIKQIQGVPHVQIYNISE
jgi:uncharacterized protein